MKNQNQCSVNDILGRFVSVGISQYHQYRPADKEEEPRSLWENLCLVSAAWVLTALLSKDVQLICDERLKIM